MKLRVVIAAGACLLACLFLVSTASLAQGSSARKAIEKLEGCSAQERSSGCVKILKTKSVDGNRQEVKAQVRGGRIIWYEYNRKSGRAKRLN